MWMISLGLFAIVLSSCLLSAFGGLFSSSPVVKSETSSANLENARFLPQLPPHLDTSFILEFVTDGNDACDQMEPVVKRLENELGIKVRRINIQRRPDFMALFELVGGNEGGNVPFFYNRRTAQAICGATPYYNLLKLGTSNPLHSFYDAPSKVKDQNDYDPNRQKGIGLKNYISEKLFKSMRAISRTGTQKIVSALKDKE